MLCSLAALVLAASEVGAGAPPTRALTIAVYTKQAAPVADLAPQELLLSEGGKQRTVLALEPDARPLEVGLVIDSSAGVAQAYGRDLVPAVLEFWKRLPPKSQIAVWSTAPAKVVEFGTEPAQAEQKLRMVAAAGKNYAFDALTDACRALGARAAARRAVVYVGGRNLDASRSGTTALMQAIGRGGVTPMVVLVLPAGRDGSLGGVQSDNYGWDVQGYFEQMAKAYGGSYAESFSTLAVAEWLRRSAADLNGQYRLRYASEATPGPLKVEVKRKDTRVRLGRPQLVETTTIGEQQALLAR